MEGKVALGGQGVCVKLSKGNLAESRCEWGPRLVEGIGANGNDEDPLEGQSPQVLRGNHTAIEHPGLSITRTMVWKDVDERDI